MFPKCKNCGAPEGLHNFATYACPENCEDQTGKQIEMWLATSYEPQDDKPDQDNLELAFANAIHALDAARMNLHCKAETVIAARESLERARSQALLENKFDGKNAETREAQAREHFHVAYDELSAFEADERRAKLEFDLALSALELAKYRLRIAELTK